MVGLPDQSLEEADPCPDARHAPQYAGEYLKLETFVPRQWVKAAQA